MNLYVCMYMLIVDCFINHDRVYFLLWIIYTKQNEDADVSKALEEGFGPNGLGIVAISGVRFYSLLCFLEFGYLVSNR